MNSYNLSFHVGSEVNHDHNARRTVKDYIDTSRMKENHTIERDASKLVAKLYEKELREENERKKPSRRIPN